jgi:hypothetical protein
MSPLALIPLARAELKTSLPDDEVRALLQRTMRQSSSVIGAFIGAPAKQLISVWKRGRFIVVRKPGYRNSYMPFAAGCVAVSQRGSVIRLTFFAPLSVLGVLILAVAGYVIWTQGVPIDKSVFITVAGTFAVLFHGVGVALFAWERGKMEREIRAIIRGGEVGSNG